jgi:hypothetical protein
VNETDGIASTCEAVKGEGREIWVVFDFDFTTDAHEGTKRERLEVIVSLDVQSPANVCEVVDGEITQQRMIPNFERTTDICELFERERSERVVILDQQGSTDLLESREQVEVYCIGADNGQRTGDDGTALCVFVSAVAMTLDLFWFSGVVVTSTRRCAWAQDQIHFPCTFTSVIVLVGAEHQIGQPIVV